MSPIGRIFAILNLVLAAVFLAWASNTLATSAKYRGKYEGEQTAHGQTRTDLEGQLETARRNHDDQRAQTNRLIAERDGLGAQVERLEKDLAAAKTENSELNAHVGRLSNSLDALQAHNKDLVAQKDQAFQTRVDAENRAMAAERSEQQAKSRIQEAEQQILALNNAITDFEKQVAASGKQIGGLETQLAQLVDLTGASLSDIIPQKRVEGTVLKALYDVPPGLVAINKGKNDGVVRGYTFEIYSGNQYKGRVRIQNVRDEMSTGLILDTVPGVIIRQGDSAATVL